MVEAGGVELHEFHVADGQASTPGHGHAVASRAVGVGGVEVDLSGTTGRQDGVRGADGEDFAGLAVEEVGTEAGVAAADLEPAGRQKVDGHEVLADVDVVARARGLRHRADDLGARDVAAVQDAADAVAALAAEVVGGVGFARAVARRPLEADAPALEVGDARRAGGDDFAGDRGIGQSGTGDEGVLEVRVHAVGVIDGYGDAALGVGGVALGQIGLGAEDGAPVSGEFEGRGKAGEAGADDEVVAIDDLHGGMVSPRGGDGKGGRLKSPPAYLRSLHRTEKSVKCRAFHPGNHNDERRSG